MDNEKIKGIIEGILFASARNVKMRELMMILDLDADTINKLILEMQDDYKNENRGIEIVKVGDGFELASKKEYYEYLYSILDKRMKPQLSNAAMEVLSIIAYNNRITKSDIDTIRGVDSSGTIYKLQDYGLVEQAGKADLPGKPMTYKVTNEFLKMFDLKSLKDLPDLPKFKLDSNRQIVIDDVEAEQTAEEIENDKKTSDEDNGQNSKETTNEGDGQNSKETTNEDDGQNSKDTTNEDDDQNSKDTTNEDNG